MQYDCSELKSKNTYLTSIIKWAEIEGKVYFKSGFVCPGIFSLDIDTLELHILEEKQPENWSLFAYGEAIAVGRKVLFVPYESNYLSVYDVDKKEVIYIAKKYSERYYYALNYDNQSVLMLSNETNSINRTMLYSVVGDRVSYPFEGVQIYDHVHGFGCIKQDKLYLPIESGQIITISLTEGSVEYIDLSHEINDISNIIIINDSFFLVSEKNGVYKWDGKKQTENINCTKLEDIKGEYDYSNKAIVRDNSIYFIQGFRGTVCILNTLNNIFEEKKLLEINEGFGIGFPNLCSRFGYFEVSDGKKNIPYMVTGDEKVELMQSLKFTDEINLIQNSKYMIEYSEYALNQFIQEL